MADPVGAPEVSVGALDGGGDRVDLDDDLIPSRIQGNASFCLCLARDARA